MGPSKISSRRGSRSSPACGGQVLANLVVHALVGGAHRGDAALDGVLIGVDDGLQAPVSIRCNLCDRGHTIVTTIIVSHGALEVQRGVLGAAGDRNVTSVRIVVDDSGFIGVVKLPQ